MTKVVRVGVSIPAHLSLHRHSASSIWNSVDTDVESLTDLSDRYGQLQRDEGGVRQVVHPQAGKGVCCSETATLRSSGKFSLLSWRRRQLQEEDKSR